MSTHTVADVLAAEAIEGRRRGHLVRSKSDPHLLIGGGTGNIYLRADGAPWEWPGYRRPLPTSDLEPWTAFDDVTVLRDGATQRVEHKGAPKQAA